MIWFALYEGHSWRPLVFFDTAIQFCLSIKLLFKLPLALLEKGKITPQA